MLSSPAAAFRSSEKSRSSVGMVRFWPCRSRCGGSPRGSGPLSAPWSCPATGGVMLRFREQHTGSGHRADSGPWPFWDGSCSCPSKLKQDRVLSKRLVGSNIGFLPWGRRRWCAREGVGEQRSPSFRCVRGLGHARLQSRGLQCAQKYYFVLSTVAVSNTPSDRNRQRKSTD